MSSEHTPTRRIWPPVYPAESLGLSWSEDVAGDVWGNAAETLRELAQRYTPPRQLLSEAQANASREFLREYRGMWVGEAAPSAGSIEDRIRETQLWQQRVATHAERERVASLTGVTAPPTSLTDMTYEELETFMKSFRWELPPECHWVVGGYPSLMRTPGAGPSQPASLTPIYLMAGRVCHVPVMPGWEAQLLEQHGGVGSPYIGLVDDTHRVWVISKTWRLHPREGGYVDFDDEDSLDYRELVEEALRVGARLRQRASRRGQRRIRL